MGAFKRWRKRKIAEGHPVLAEVSKQVVDQPLHVLMTVASVLLIGYPLFVYADWPMWGAALFAGVATTGWVGLRELYQWPSPNWWDPCMDWFFEAGGLALGLWILIAKLG